MRKLTYIVPPQDAGRTLRSLLCGRLHLSKHRIASLKFNGGILLDGEPVHTDARAQAGQTISVLLEDSMSLLTPFPLPLNVPYRDRDLLIVDKPASLPSISSIHQSSQTLENALFAYLGCPERFIYRPVSRLDKGTSGLMPIALNAVAQDRLQRMLHTEGYVREYLAVTEGEPKQAEGVIDAPIAHAEGVRRCISPEGKPSRTHYRVLQSTENGRALLCLRLETGRTHQIRVHLASLGCPITGDPLYGTPLAALDGRFALHSAFLCLRHPITEEEICLQSPLPEPLCALL